MRPSRPLPLLALPLLTVALVAALVTTPEVAQAACSGDGATTLLEGYDICGDIPSAGCCTNHSTRQWCDIINSDTGYEAICQQDCTVFGAQPTCGYDEGFLGTVSYQCGMPFVPAPNGKPIICTTICEPTCGDDICGDNGCQGICGTCYNETECVEGSCQQVCHDCAAEGWECGDNGCGMPCGFCTGEAECTDHVCVGGCSCVGKECGDDGCGESCGTCPEGEACNDEFQCECVPACDGKQCGPDGCGSTCGACNEGWVCIGSGQCCEPVCDGKECGPDGCGGSCGACPGGGSCQSDGTCPAVVAEPTPDIVTSVDTTTPPDTTSPGSDTAQIDTAGSDDSFWSFSDNGNAIFVCPPGMELILGECKTVEDGSPDSSEDDDGCSASPTSRTTALPLLVLLLALLGVRRLVA